MKKANILFAVILGFGLLFTLIKFLMALYGFSPAFKSMMTVTRWLFILFAYVHAIYTLKKKAIVFIGLTMAVMLAAEWVCCVRGIEYYTSFLWAPKIYGQVPLTIPIQWFPQIYIPYCVINYIYSKNRKNLSTLVIFLLACASGFCAAAYDMGRELVMLKLGVWGYPGGGAYFGVPLFYLWFALPAILTFIFLFYESRISREKISEPDFFPVIAYFLLCLTIISEAIAIRYTESIYLEAFSMLPYVVIALLLATRTWKGKSKEIA